MESEPVSWMIFVCVLTPSIAFAISFGKIMWIEVLKVVAKKSARLFRYMTCGSRNITEFKLQYLDESDSDDNNASLDDDVQEQNAAGNKKLAGFTAKKENYSKQMLDAMEQTEKKKDELRKMLEEANNNNGEGQLADDSNADVANTSQVGILPVDATPSDKVIEF